VADEIAAQLRRMADVPGGTALLLVYLLLEVEEAWEVSYHYEPLWGVLRGAQDAAHDHGAGPTGDDEAAVRAVLALMQSLDEQILMENALTCGQLTAYTRAAEAAVVKACEAADLASRMVSGFPELGAWLAGAAERYRIQNDVSARGARAIVKFFDSGAFLDEAIECLSEAERAVSSQRSRSELRASRASLMALSRYRDTEWLRIEHGRMVYVYPFAIRGLAPEKVAAAVRADAREWQFAQVSPADVLHSLHIADGWNSSDPHGRRYEGASIELPDISIRSIDGELIGRATAQIRISELGNHYVRLESEILDASPGDLNEMLMRAAPEYGVVRVAFENEEGWPEWDRISDFAMQLVADLSTRLTRADGGAVSAISRPGMFQVVVSVNSASKTQGPAGIGPRTEVLTPGEFRSTVGAQVLANPVVSNVGSLAEWSRYSIHEGTSVVLPDITVDWTVRTCNTIVLVALSSPEWVASTRMEIAEFVASLDGLFAGWSSELASHYRRAKGFQERVVAVRAVESTEASALDDLSRELDEERIRLNDFAVETRSVMTLIRSPSLVSSPVVAETLEILLDRSNYRKNADELVFKIEEVTHEQLGLTVEKLRQQRIEQISREAMKRERQQRAKLDTMLAVIAAVGVSGLGQIFQTGYDIKSDGALAVIFLIVLLAVVVGGWFWRAAGRREP
jgi:hypothetical protein